MINLDRINCVVCNKEIKNLYPDLESHPDQSSWNDGIVGSISAGYGSVRDGEVYIIGICDDCVKDKYYSKQLIYSHDYMFPKDKYPELDRPGFTLE